jgi:hypothetical protein
LSKTRIELQYPYSEDYIAGYLNINKEPRRVVLLVDKNRKYTSTSYARYLMSCHLKRYLNKDEHVDHIDNDKLNDVVENYQLLTLQENNKKGKRSKWVKYKCYGCGKVFEKIHSQSHLNGFKHFSSCSLKCSNIIKSKYKNNLDEFKKIGQEQIIEVFYKQT